MKYYEPLILEGVILKKYIRVLPFSHQYVESNNFHFNIFLNFI